MLGEQLTFYKYFEQMDAYKCGRSCLPPENFLSQEPLSCLSNI